MKYLYFLILLIFLFLSCSKINPDPKIPSYIHIDAISLKTEYAKEGTNRANILDAWVYVDKEFIGAYELPVTFPVLKTGTGHSVTIRAGVIMNDNLSIRSRYNCYGPYDLTDVTLTAGQVTTIKPDPVVSYFQTTNLLWIEDFDRSIGLDSVSGSSTGIYATKDSSKVYEGSRSAYISLDKDHTSAEVITTNKYTLSKDSKTFFEFHFNSDIPFYVSLKAQYTNNSPQFVYSKKIVATGGKWVKGYLDLSDAVSGQSNTTGFQVDFSSYLTDGSSGTIYLDNLKLVQVP